MDEFAGGRKGDSKESSPIQPQGGEPSPATQGQGGFEVPSISLPKGGGAIRGIVEKFAANPLTGTGSMAVPIAVCGLHVKEAHWLRLVRRQGNFQIHAVWPLPQFFGHERRRNPEVPSVSRF